MVAAIKLLHLLEAFSTPWFLFSAPANHHLVFFLLEIFNNIIQYQFDGNSNLVYTIIRKRHVFHALANLPSDLHGIAKCLNNRKGGSNSSSGVRTSRLIQSSSSPSLTLTTSGSTGPAAITTTTTSTTATNLTMHRNNTVGNHLTAIGVGGRSTNSGPTSLSVDGEDESSDGGDGKSDIGEISMEGSKPALPAEPGTLKVSLLDTPGKCDCLFCRLLNY